MKQLSAALLLGSLALTACNGDNKTTLPGTGTMTGPMTTGPMTSAVTSVSGTVVELGPNQNAAQPVTVPWSGGAGEVAMLSMASGETLASTPLSASGNFSLSLPTSLPADQLDTLDQDAGDENCSGSFKSSDPSSRGTTVTFAVNASKSGAVKSGAVVPMDITNQADSIKGIGGSFVYVDRNVNIAGSKSCTSGNVSYTIARDIHLVKGWNYVTADYTYMGNTNNSASVKFTTGKTPPAQWIYLDMAFPAMQNQGSF